MTSNSVSKTATSPESFAANRVWFVIFMLTALIALPVFPVHTLVSSSDKSGQFRFDEVNGNFWRAQAIFPNTDNSSRSICRSQALPFSRPTARASIQASTHQLSEASAASLARCQALLQAKQLPLAAEELHKLVLIDPQIALPHQLLGLISVSKNKTGVAMNEFEIAAKIDPTDANIHNNLGVTYLSCGKKSLAQKEFEEAITCNPEHVEAAINLANMLSLQAEYDKAAVVLKRSLLFNPNCAQIHNNLGSVLSASGQYQSAVAEFKTSLQLNSRLSSAHYGLGETLLQLKLYPDSIKEFKNALLIDPRLSEAQNKIDIAYRRSQLALGNQSLN